MSQAYQSTCDECGWTSKVTRHQGRAEYALRIHSCDKQRRRDADRARGEARRAAVDRTPKPCHHKEATHQHGTHGCYVLDRCRCHPCSKANREYERDRTRQQAYGRWNGYVDAEPARRHVRELMAAGMGLKRIVKVSGVSQGVLWKLLYGKLRPDGSRIPSRRIKPATEQRILATQLDLAGGAKVDQTGTARRIQALVAIGWSMSKIASELGVDPTNFTPIAHGRRQVVAATERAVRDLYDRWSMMLPPNTTHRDKISVSRARRYAAELGWAPPLAWDDDALDAPDAAPVTALEHKPGVDEVAIQRRAGGDKSITLTRAERWQLVETLHAQGLSDGEIARRTGYADRTVLRDRRELGLTSQTEREAAA